MARIRTIKPDFFRHEGLYDAERQSGLPLRVAFAGLWTAADREGRFRWHPRALKLDCLPYDEVDFSRVLDALVTRGFVVKYAIAGEVYGAIPGWKKHQVINNRESDSSLPEPSENTMISDASATRHDLAQAEGKGRGKEGENSVAIATGADAPQDPAIPEREYFLRGREVLGKGAGGLIGKLLKAKGGNVALARAAIEQASQKQDPAEYVAAICRGPPTVRATTVHQAKHAEGRAILDELHEFNSRAGSGTDSRILRHDPGNVPEGVRSGAGGNLIDVSPGSD